MKLNLNILLSFLLIQTSSILSYQPIEFLDDASKILNNLVNNKEILDLDLKSTLIDSTRGFVGFYLYKKIEKAFPVYCEDQNNHSKLNIKNLSIRFISISLFIGNLISPNKKTFITRCIASQVANIAIKSKLLK